MSSPRIRHPATAAAAAEHRRRGGRVVGERGRLLVPLLGLADQGAGEGQLGQVLRARRYAVRALLRRLGRPREGGAQLVGHRVEPGPPVLARRRRQSARGAQAPAQVPARASSSSPASASRSVPYWRIVSNARYAVPLGRRRHRQQALLGEAGQPVGARLLGARTRTTSAAAMAVKGARTPTPGAAAPVGRLQQRVAPVQRRPYRAVPVVGAGPPASIRSGWRGRR